MFHVLRMEPFYPQRNLSLACGETKIFKDTMIAIRGLACCVRHPDELREALRQGVEALLTFLNLSLGKLLVMNVGQASDPALDLGAIAPDGNCSGEKIPEHAILPSQTKFIHIRLSGFHRVIPDSQGKREIIRVD